MPHMNTPQFTLEGSPNFRDLGGYVTSDGRIVRSGILFRSGHLAQLTDGDVARLDELGISTIVDFRPQHEIEIFGPDRIDGDIRKYSFPISDHDAGPDFYESIQAGDFSGLHDLAKASRKMIRDNAAEFGALLRLVGEGDNLPLIFHCIGGKDRTGVAAALILTLVGVPWDTVREDYLRSNKTLEGVLEEQISRLSGGKVPVGRSNDANIEALRRFFILDGANIDAARDEVMRISGSFENYAGREAGPLRSLTWSRCAPTSSPTDRSPEGRTYRTERIRSPVTLRSTVRAQLSGPGQLIEHEPDEEQVVVGCGVTTLRDRADRRHEGRRASRRPPPS